MNKRELRIDKTTAPHKPFTQSIKFIPLATVTILKI